MRWLRSPSHRSFWTRRRCLILRSIPLISAPRAGREQPLLEHLIRELETRDVFTLWLEVRASNVAAIALYESLGFNEATIRRRNYHPTAEGREDAIIMALPIG